MYGASVKDDDLWQGSCLQLSLEGTKWQDRHWLRLNLRQQSHAPAQLNSSRLMIGLLKNLQATGKSCYAKSRISYEANSKGNPSVPLRIADGQDYDGQP